MNSLEGQVSIITGGGTGIGKETALIFGREGAKIVLAGRRLGPLEELLHSRQAALQRGHRAPALVITVSRVVGRYCVIILEPG